MVHTLLKILFLSRHIGGSEELCLRSMMLVLESSSIGGKIGMFEFWGPLRFFSFVPSRSSSKALSSTPLPSSAVCGPSVVIENRGSGIFSSSRSSSGRERGCAFREKRVRAGTGMDWAEWT